MRDFEKKISIVLRDTALYPVDNHTQTDLALHIQDMQGIENNQRNISTKTNSAGESASLIPENRNNLSLHTLYDPFRSDYLQDSSRETPH
jgi:hypothetical protein